MIVFTTQNFLPDIGGIQTYIAGLADALSARGHEIAVYCDGDMVAGEEAFDRSRRYPVVRFHGIKPWRRRSKARAVVRHIGAGDVIIADSWKSVELLPKHSLPRAKVFCIAHGAELLAVEGSAKARRIARAFDKVNVAVSNSRSTEKLCARFLRPHTKSVVALPGVIATLGADREYRAHPSSCAKRLLTVARLDPYKGIDTALRAIAALAQTHDDLTYDIVGDGVDRDRLPALARELGIADRVTFHGRAPDSKKSELLRNADVFVLPNRSEPGEVEGFGIVFVEAGAFGLPCVAGQDGGTSDAVVAGETGLIVDGSDLEAVRGALSDLLNDPAKRQRMGRAGHARFWSEFAWENAVKRFEAVLGL